MVFVADPDGSAILLKLDPDPHHIQNSEALRRLKMEPWTVESSRFKMGPWRVRTPVVADWHHFDERQDPDPHLFHADPQPCFF